MTPLEPRQIAELDQAEAGMKAYGQLLGQFFNALLDQGLERAEALELVHHHMEDREAEDPDAAYDAA